MLDLITAEERIMDLTAVEETSMDLIANGESLLDRSTAEDFSLLKKGW